jgi:hypothetical protein
MKKILLLLSFLGLALAGFSQVGINNDNSAPDPSAMLDVKSTSRGLLIPRMTTYQMNAIAAPIDGLLVYNVSVKALYWYNGTTWKKFNELTYTESDPVFALHPASGILLTDIDSWNKACLNRITGVAGTPPLSLNLSNHQITGSLAKADANADGYLSSDDWNAFNSKVSSQWVSTGQNISYNTGQVSVGTTNPSASAALEVNSTSQGFLPPRMTMAQRDAIANPALGLMIYCLDCPVPNNLQIFTGAGWNPMAYNRFPYATSVTQSGSSVIGSMLTGNYIYGDADNDPQGTSIYHWYRAESTSGLNEAAISGANSITYMLAPADSIK